jgi:UDPglucose--hexose-1-phosphate uridylyltransferase
MSDFQFLQSASWRTNKWVILAPRRANRPDVAKGSEPVCPFCPGKEGEEKEVFRLPSSIVIASEAKFDLAKRGNLNEIASSQAPRNDNVQGWSVRVVPNKFPFAPIHEVVIHSPDHHKNFDKLPMEHVSLILQAYKHRFNEHSHKGQVYIFHNNGSAAGESLPHPHSQIAVVPFEVAMDIPMLATQAEYQIANDKFQMDTIKTDHFSIFCPPTSQWPDEVWIAPKLSGRSFGEITENEIQDLAKTIQSLIQILDLRHGNEFPYNFYIYPGGDWYLRIIPRVKTLGGFEVGTGIFVNTQDPQETLAFLKAHLPVPVGGLDREKIKAEHQAEYKKGV